MLSMATTLETLKTINDDKELSTFFLSILYKRLPEQVKTALFDPYMSADGNQMRFSVRIFESDPNLRRAELLSKIRTHLVDGMGFKPEQVHLTGMLVLYNNVLQSLYRSQIATIGFVFLAIMIMFMILFRSLKVALIALVPNMVAAATVLGLMGIFSIPLDIMTITIAAITIGIGVDDSIHYVHRFSVEFQRDGDYEAAVKTCSWQHRPGNVLHVDYRGLRLFDSHPVKFHTDNLFRCFYQFCHVICHGGESDLAALIAGLVQTDGNAQLNSLRCGA